MVRLRFFVVLVAALLALLMTSGCGDDPFFGFVNGGFTVGEPIDGWDGGNAGDEGTGGDQDCPIPVPTPEPDPEATPTPEPTPEPEATPTPTDGDDGYPANGRQCEVNEFTVCHFPRGNPDNYFTICIGNENAFDAHLRHGDDEGPCEDVE